MRNKIDIRQRIAGTDGFTIVELMVSLVLLLFISLALMQTALVGMDSTTRNMLRDEGVQIAQQKLDNLRNVQYSKLVSVYNGTSGTVTRKLRNINQVYSVSNTVTSTSTGVSIVRMNVLVSWSWRGQSYDTSLSTVRGQQ